MKHTAVISGVGMVPFAKPGASAPYYQMGAEAARQALADAGGWTTPRWSKPTWAMSMAIPPAASERSIQSA